MHVKQAACAVGRQDDETVVLSVRGSADGVLADGRAENRCPVPSPDQPRLFVAVTGVDPFKPVINRADRAMGPDRPEVRAVGDFLDPGIDRLRAIRRPVRSPTPAHGVGVQPLVLQVQQGELRGGGGVIVPQGFVADAIDQRVGDAQHRYEVVDSTVLRQSSAHGLTLRLRRSDRSFEFSCSRRNRPGKHRNQTLCTLSNLGPPSRCGPTTDERAKDSCPLKYRP
ncbi:hypothetical protein D3C86_1100280 [compost metagenome]